MNKETQKFTFEIEIPVYRKVKKGNMTTIPMTMDVVGMMTFIKRAMPDKNKQDLLDEYAKFWVMNQVGVKSYPIVK